MWIRLLILSLFLPLFSFGQLEEARKSVEILCSDTLYGRGYVNDGLEKSANYIASEFKALGVEPYLGETYFQKFSYPVNTFPGKMRVHANGKELKPGVDYLVNQYSGSFTGNLELIPLGVTAIENPSSLAVPLQEIFAGNKNGFIIDLTTCDPKEVSQVQRNFMELAEVGVVVFLTDEKFTWSVAQRQLNSPIISIQKEVASYDSEFYVDIEAVLVPKFETKNVIGYIPAKKRPHKAKTIVFSAHYDHLGVMGTNPQITIFPGANDNASGVSMLFTLAKHYKENPSKYNMLFIAFSGEEIGLLGSLHLVESKEVDLSRIKFLINLDIMGSGEEGITVVNGSIFTKEFKKLEKINKKNEYLTTIKTRGEAPNSDHWYFYKAGVPSIFIYTMGPNKHYHDIYDTYEELSFSAYENIMKLIMDFVKKL